MKDLSQILRNTIKHTFEVVPLDIWTLVPAVAKKMGLARMSGLLYEIDYMKTNYDSMP